MINQTLIDIARENNIVIYDSQAEPGDFTARLVSLAKTTARRKLSFKIKYIYKYDCDTAYDYYGVYIEPMPGWLDLKDTVCAPGDSKLGVCVNEDGTNAMFISY